MRRRLTTPTQNRERMARRVTPGIQAEDFLECKLATKKDNWLPTCDLCANRQGHGDLVREFTNLDVTINHLNTQPSKQILTMKQTAKRALSLSTPNTSKTGLSKTRQIESKASSLAALDRKRVSKRNIWQTQLLPCRSCKHCQQMKP